MGIRGRKNVLAGNSPIAGASAPRPGILNRRRVIGGLSVAGLAAAGTTAYRTAPGFWRQYINDWSRQIPRPEFTPTPAAWPDTGIHAAWIGHTTVLMKIDGFTILTDPVFSDRAGIGLGLITLGIKRLVAPALNIEQLPPIDLLLLSHAHMDHWDIPSLRALESKHTQVVTARATSDLLRVPRYSRVTELGWDQQHRAGPLTLRAIHVNHWGARLRSDTYRGFNGYLIDAGRHRILFAGDTADTQVFRTVRTSRPIDLAIMPIGAYNPWIHYHCTPEQAWRMANEAGAERVLPVHHQTFTLSREPSLEPIERLLDSTGGHTGRVLVRQIGQQVSL